MQDAGTVKKLSVAVVVDGTYTTDANGTRTYAPRSEADMANITALVRSAVGFSETRGDQVQVTNMRFAEPEATPGEEGTSEPLLGIESAIWLKIAEILILSVTALLVFLLVVKPMIRRLTTPPGTPEAAGATALAGAQGAPAIAHATPAAPGAAQIGAGPAQAALPKRESMIDVSPDRRSGARIRGPQDRRRRSGAPRRSHGHRTHLASPTDLERNGLS